MLFVMHISGAKFEEHCSSISRDIADSVLPFLISGIIYDVITFDLHNTKMSVSLKRKKIIWIGYQSMAGY